MSYYCISWKIKCYPLGSFCNSLEKVKLNDHPLFGNDGADEEVSSTEDSENLEREPNVTSTEKDAASNEKSNVTRTFEKGEVILSKLVKIIEMEADSKEAKSNRSIDTDLNHEMPINDDDENDTTVGLNSTEGIFTPGTTGEDLELEADLATAVTEEEYSTDDFTTFETEELEDESMFNVSNVDTLNQDQSVSRRNCFDLVILLACLLGVLYMI